MSGVLAGRVVTLIGEGGELERAVAIGLAEAGADLVLATRAKEQAHEFAIASIANEAWLIGTEQWMRVIDALDPVDVTTLADEVADRNGHCDLLVVHCVSGSRIPFDELNHVEVEGLLRTDLVAPILAAQAFGRLLERDGGGAIAFLAAPARERDAVGTIVRAALDGLAVAVEKEFSGVRAKVLDERESAPLAAQVVAFATGR